MKRILVLGNDKSIVEGLPGLLGETFLLVTAQNAATLLDTVKTGEISVVLLDLQTEQTVGTELLRTIHCEVDPHLPVIVILEHLDSEVIVELMRLGAYDCLSKQMSLPDLAEKICKAIGHNGIAVGKKSLQGSGVSQYDRMVYASDCMKSVSYEITRLARLDFDVLLFGETGVGKDLVAFELHQRSERQNMPFIPIALKSLTETLIESELFGHEKGAFSGADKTKIGKLEAAQGGTVYIPEVSSLSESIQLKLLQFMQYKTISRVGQDARRPEARIDVRVILATNELLEEQVKKGRMREDFYHRISGVKVNIPPLRERPDDIEPLACYFLEKYSGGIEGERFAIDQEVLAAFHTYRWPGNVRELENWIRSGIAYASSSTLTLADFPLLVENAGPRKKCHLCMAKEFSSLPDYKTAEEAFKNAYFTELLKRSGQNITKAAQKAGMTPQGFRKALHALNIKVL